MRTINTYTYNDIDNWISYKLSIFYDNMNGAIARMMAAKFYIETYGCQMNIVDSRVIAKLMAPHE